MIQDGLKITGSLKVCVFDKDGNVKDERQINNLVVTAGKNFIASRMTGTPTAMSHMAIGAGTTAADAANTALETELGRVSLTSGTTTGAVTTYVATFGAGTGTGAVTEAGILNAGSGGTLLCRSVFAVVNKGADDGMSITWQITVS
jgi:hypothetical protein